MAEIYVIGLDGSGGLSAQAMERLERAGEILASARLAGMFSSMAGCAGLAHKLRVINSPDETCRALNEARGPVAVIASGDPMFFGIGTRIIDGLPDAEVEIIPALSSVQLAFARLGMSWHDAYFVSLHGNIRRAWAVDDLPLLARRHRKLVLLTGGGNTPAALARQLPAGAMVHVLERLGLDGERVVSAPAPEIADMEFGEPNLMVVLNPPGGDCVCGLTEDEFSSQGGLITKDEVRAVALHKLRLPHEGVLWDVGAGTGSVSIEARRMSPGLLVYAIEKDAARLKDMADNIRRHSAGAINVVQGQAPDALAALPAPDRVFIGGSGSALAGVMDRVLDVMEHGIVVVSAITLESLTEACAIFKARGVAHSITSLLVARSRELGGREYLRAENQIYLIKGDK